MHHREREHLPSRGDGGYGIPVSMAAAAPGTPQTTHGTTSFRPVIAQAVPMDTSSYGRFPFAQASATPFTQPNISESATPMVEPEVINLVEPPGARGEPPAAQQKPKSKRLQKNAQLIAILFNSSADIELYKSYFNGEVVKHGKKGKSMTELRERLKMCKEFQPLPTVETLVSWLDEAVKDRLQEAGGVAGLTTPGLHTGDGDTDEEVGIHSPSEMRQAVDEYIMLASDHMKKLKKAKDKKKREDAVLEGMVSEAFNNSGPKQRKKAHSSKAHDPEDGLSDAMSSEDSGDEEAACSDDSDDDEEEERGSDESEEPSSSKQPKKGTKRSTNKNPKKPPKLTSRQRADEALSRSVDKAFKALGSSASARQVEASAAELAAKAQLLAAQTQAATMDKLLKFLEKSRGE